MATARAASVRKAAVPHAGALVEAMRPANNRTSLMVFVGAGALLGAADAQLALGASLILAVYGIAVILNDLCDQDVDRANNRKTPLVSGDVTPIQAWVLLGGCLALVAVEQAWLHQPVAGAFSSIYLALAVAYSAPHVAIEDRGLAATTLLAICYFVLPLWLASGLAGARPAHFWILAAAMGLLGAAGLLYKDFKDRQGDREAGKATPLVRYGDRAVVALSFLFAGAGGTAVVAVGTRRPLAIASISLAWCALVAVAARRGANPWLVQLYYLADVLALLSAMG
ncbi:MAG: UbiA family prenyltransferase [Acidimicrobiales bacterium]